MLALPPGPPQTEGMNPRPTCGTCRIVVPATTKSLAATILLAGATASADFQSGFEAGEGYTGAPGSASTTGGASQLVPQNGWIKQFGNNFDVHTYAGARIPWTPSSNQTPENYPVAPRLLPFNPNGGEQFIALGTSDSSGGGRDQLPVEFPNALVEVSVDFCNAYEHDFPNYQGSILARDGGGHMGGIYTSAGSDEPTLNLNPPRSGPWAISVLAYDASGVELDEDVLDRFYRFDGTEGFDNLPRETWHRLGFVLDLDPASPSYRQFTQLKCQDLITGQLWVMENPRAFAGTPRESPLYLRGGANAIEQPSLIGLYNVGNGQISMFDNLYVGAPYDWTGSKRDRLQLTFTPRAEAGTLRIEWPSRPGNIYHLRSTTNPGAAEPSGWPIYDGHMDLAATPPMNSLTLPFPVEDHRFFVVEQNPAPPVQVFADNFENGQGGWTTGIEGDAGTAWGLGIPAILPTGPQAAHSPDHCYGTNIDGPYTANALAWLRSPAIDLSGAVEATLSFFHFKDMEVAFDFGTINILDAEDDSLIAELVSGLDNFTTDWEEITRTLPAEALGRSILVEFRFESDAFNTPPYSGWYLDDVEVMVRR